MSKLLEKMKKATNSKYADVLSKSEVYNNSLEIVTDTPMINVALSGAVTGGFKSGILGICGESRHFKTMFALKIASAFLKKDPENILLFLDSEFGSPQEYFESVGISTDRVFHVPVTNLEELTFEAMQQISGFDRNEKVMIVIDSIGNVASKREVDNSLEGKGSKDMTRAAMIKSLFRQITPMAKLKNIPIVFVGHIYKEQGAMYPKNIVSGGQGVMLAANDIWIITRAKERDDDGELGGYRFTINIEKSRFVKEGGKIPISVSFDAGVNVYSGVLDLAIEGGFVSNASKGWYQLIDKATGELVGGKVRSKDTETKEFLGSVITNPAFSEYCKSQFKLVKANLDNSTVEEDLDAV
jgi:RecA/RadA recombinase